ncbi:MAG: hypothetical protein IJC66_06130, partial [Kiritimatiellae bacterium]|nr:hypothetical protein [Kiritimatiellia bacterium]
MLFVVQLHLQHGDCVVIRLSNNAFIRHVAEESMIWCPRTGGCTVMRYARPILEEVIQDWRSEDEIVRVVAAKFEAEAEDVKEGVDGVFEELIKQRFVEVKPPGETSAVPIAGSASVGETPVAAE